MCTANDVHIVHLMMMQNILKHALLGLVESLHAAVQSAPCFHQVRLPELSGSYMLPVCRGSLWFWGSIMHAELALSRSRTAPRHNDVINCPHANMNPPCRSFALTSA